MSLDPDPSLTAASLSNRHNVPALRDPQRFELAVFGALGAWWEYDHTHGQHDDPPWRLLPAPPPTDSLFLALLDGGLGRWWHVRARLEEWYLDDVLSYERAIQTKTLRATGITAYPVECFRAEREAAAHRFLAVVQLVDSAHARADPDLAPWIWPDPPLRVRTPLLTAAAQARLTFACPSLDDPTDGCSAFERSDLLARVRKAAEQEGADRGFHYALADVPPPPASFFSQAEP